MKSPVIQILFGISIAFGLLRMLSSSKAGQVVIWLLVATALLTVVVIWMLRNRRDELAKYYTKPGCKAVIDFVCKISNEQPPRARSDKDGELVNLRLRMDGDFAALRAHVLKCVYGFDGVAEDVVERLRRNLGTRRQVAASEFLRPLGIFYLAAPAGSGRRYLAEHFAVGLYNSGSSIYYDLRVFNHPGAVATFTGGTGEKNSLVAQVVASPECTVILENVSHASPEIWSFLQGIFTNGFAMDPDKGVPVHFRDSVFFLLESPEQPGKPQAKPHPNPLLNGEAALGSKLPHSFLATLDRHYAVPWISYFAAAEVMVDLMQRECRKFQVELEHVRAPVVAGAAKKFAEIGFETAPAWVSKELEPSLHDAVSHGKKALRVG